MLYRDFCILRYNELFSLYYNQFLNGRTSENARQAAERDAQREAIRIALTEGLAQYPDEDASNIWKSIYVAHLMRKANIDNLMEIDEEIISSVISADQSWKKSSGHSFEAFICATVNPMLESYNIRFALQREVTELINSGGLSNDQQDLDWIRTRLNGSIFDLYALVTINGNTYVYGCIQSKTSIRDRVTRDREPSRQAMDARFWSSVVTLNGAFLQLPKFQHMVNGGSDEFPDNGWHGMYALYTPYANGRIYRDDRCLSLMTRHAIEAANVWCGIYRLRLSHEWLPNNN